MSHHQKVRTLVCQSDVGDWIRDKHLARIIWHDGRELNGPLVKPVDIESVTAENVYDLPAHMPRTEQKQLWLTVIQRL